MKACTNFDFTQFRAKKNFLIVKRHFNFKLQQKMENHNRIGKRQRNYTIQRKIVYKPFMCHLSGVMKNCETWFDILNLSIYNFNKNQHYEHMFGI